MRPRAQIERFFELSLLGLVAAGFLAVAGSGLLDVPTIVLVALGLGLRVVRLQLPGRALNLITISYIAFFVLDYYWISGRLLEATVHLICFLAVMKILTARTNRDYAYTAAIALMELVAAAMLSNSLGFFVYLAIYLFCAAAAFMSAEMKRAIAKDADCAASPGVPWRLGLLTSFVTMGILVLTVVLFVVLPRTANAAFRHLRPAGYHLSGFSDEVTLGQVGEIQKDSRPVMHVKPYSRSALMPPDLKWRGAALSYFNGWRWTDDSGDGKLMLPERNPLTLADEAQRSRRDGIRLLYRVDLTATDSDALFVAGVPEYLNIERARVIRTATGGYRLLGTSGQPVRYEVSSFVPFGLRTSRAELSETQRNRYLQIPNLDPRVAELARQWAGDSLGLERAHRLETHLRKDFQYSLEMEGSAGGDPLADFLFRRKKGHCEYFASAMAVMLRTLGTPARIANGFQSGTYNPVSGMYLIRASDAHSWVEAYEPGLGWVTFDPTPTAPAKNGYAVWAKAAMYLDAAETFWQEWVVNYDLGRQVTLAGKLEEKTKTLRWTWPKLPSAPLPGQWKSWGPWVGGILLLVVSSVVFWRRRFAWRWRRIRRGTISASDAGALYGQMLQVMRKRGFEKPSWFTADEFAAAIPEPQLARSVAEFTAGYQALRFGGDQQLAGRLEFLLERIELNGH